MVSNMCIHSTQIVLLIHWFGSVDMAWIIHNKNKFDTVSEIFVLLLSKFNCKYSNLIKTQSKSVCI